MSKLTTRGNKRIASKIDVANKRTIGATNAVAPPTGKKKSPQADQRPEPVASRTFGKKKAKKTSAIPAGPAPVGKVQSKKVKNPTPRKK